MCFADIRGFLEAASRIPHSRRPARCAVAEAHSRGDSGEGCGKVFKGEGGITKGDSVITPVSIIEELLFTTVRIVAEEESGTERVGTGFFFDATVDQTRILPLIVTNKHVVQNARTGRFQLHEADDSGPQLRPLGRSFEIPLSNFESYWVGHPDASVDLCAMPFEPIQEQAEASGRRIFRRAFNESLILPESKLAELNAAEDILMVGYPIGLWDKTNNLPLIRRGVTASHPAVDFNGRPVFVIDAACFPGSSGSPVVLANIGLLYDKKLGAFGVGIRYALLGVLYAGPQMMAEGEIAVKPIPTKVMPIAQTPLMIHLGYVIKDREILTLACDIVQEAKRQGRL